MLGFWEVKSWIFDDLGSKDIRKDATLVAAPTGEGRNKQGFDMYSLGAPASFMEKAMFW